MSECATTDGDGVLAILAGTDAVEDAWDDPIGEGW